MKIKAIGYIMILSFFMTACASDFDKAMNSGKEALKAGKYEEAIKQFDLALIEKPNDEDAISLYNRSEESVQKEEVEKKMAQFRSVFDPIYEKLEAFNADVDLSKDPFKINDPAAQEKLGTAKAIRKELDSLTNEWAYIGGDKEAMYWNLSEATDGLINAYEYILDPPARSSSNFPDTRAGRLDAYYDNPRNLINTEFIRYTTFLDSYKQKMSPAQ